MSKTFEKLYDYLNFKMRMSHIYQPVMIRRLLLEGGKAKDEEIAIDLVSNDISQLEYYTERVNQMVGKVLRKNGVVEKHQSNYELKIIDVLNEKEIIQLVQICDEKIEAFKKQRKQDIWDHRRRNRKMIPGSVQHEVFERAKGRCELCGISNEIKHLEVDHIVPKSLGGSDEIHNFQALCYSCNSRKGNRYQNDYRDFRIIYDHRIEYCIFCHPDRKIIAENELAFALYDAFPVTLNHVLIIPKRHFDNYFEINQAELNAVHSLIQLLKERLMSQDSEIQGFNIGINQGEVAGQTIPHCHIHLIPRRKGDVDNPRGGIRHLIPGKGNY